jgi:hypothetical protein
LKCDGTRTETRYRLSAKRTSSFKSAGASVRSTTGSRGVRISGNNGSNAVYTMFRGSVKGTGYPRHSPVSLSLPLPCVTVCQRISTGVYLFSISAELLLSVHCLGAYVLISHSLFRRTATESPKACILFYIQNNFYLNGKSQCLLIILNIFLY